MFTLDNKERMLELREARFKAECGLADSLDVLAAIISLPVKTKAEKVFCYCSLKGKNALFVAFYTIGDKAFLFSDELSKGELMDFNMAIMSQLVYLKSQYEDCPEIMPSELFLEFDPATRAIKGSVGMEPFTDTNEISIRSFMWFKEHGGKLKRSAELAMKMRFKAQAEAAKNPAADAVELDMDALKLSRKYVSGQIEDPYLSKAETGWDAVRGEVYRAYSGDTLPMSFESDDSKSWVDVYDGKNCWHYVSCGLSSMGLEPEADSIGGEYTLSLKKKADQDEDDLQIFAVLNMLREAISKAQSDKALLEDYTYIPAGQGGFIAVPETKLKSVDSPVGSIAFKKLVYITASELQALEEGKTDVESLYKKIGELTAYNRKSLI